MIDSRFRLVFLCDFDYINMLQGEGMNYVHWHHLAKCGILPYWAMGSRYYQFQQLAWILMILSHVAVVYSLSSMRCWYSSSNKCEAYMGHFPNIWSTATFLCSYGPGVQVISVGFLPISIEMESHISQSHLTAEVRNQFSFFLSSNKSMQP